MLKSSAGRSFVCVCVIIYSCSQHSETLELTPSQEMIKRYYSLWTPIEASNWTFNIALTQLCFLLTPIVYMYSTWLKPVSGATHNVAKTNKSNTLMDRCNVALCTLFKKNRKNKHTWRELICQFRSWTHKCSHVPTHSRGHSLHFFL